MACLCLGPKRSGKTHLLNALLNPDTIDETTYSMPTIGTCIYKIRFPSKPNKDDGNKLPSPRPPATGGDGHVNTTTSTANGASRGRQKRTAYKFITVLEIGGAMAPMWRQYFNNVDKLIYVVDTSNLCQISAAGVLFYSILADPRLQKVKILLVLSKMDYAYRQMRNEALLMLQMSKLQKQIRQKVTIVEASAVTKEGLNIIYEWLKK